MEKCGCYCFNRKKGKVIDLKTWAQLGFAIDQICVIKVDLGENMITTILIKERHKAQGT